jgi:FtsH-binding integral membrane protein
MNTYETTFGNDSAANALPEERARFIRKTYVHLAAAILAFIALEVFLFASGAAYQIISVMRIGGSMSWLLVLGIFMAFRGSRAIGLIRRHRRWCSISDSRLVF